MREWWQGVRFYFLLTAARVFQCWLWDRHFWSSGRQGIRGCFRCNRKERLIGGRWVRVKHFNPLR